ncbi:MAG: FIST N-terminal domain-containing protein [Polyangiaceae bacterium]
MYSSLMASVTLQSGKSKLEDPNAAAEEALGQLGSGTPKVVFAFIPGPWDQVATHRALRTRLPSGVRLISASTGGELTNAGMHQHTLVLGALYGDIEVGIGLARGLSRDAALAGSQAVERAASELGTRVSALDRKYGAIVIDDGFKMKKEELLLGVLEKNQGLVLTGGGASGYEFMKGSGVIGLDGEVFDDAALVMLFRTNAPWAALRSHWFEPTGKRVHLTKVDVANRKILELDGKPAGPRWGEVVGVPPEHLTFAFPQHLLSFSLAMRVGREYFLRTITKSMTGDELESANLVQEDQELEVMTMGDPIAATRRFFVEEVPRRVPNPKAAILFDCGARRIHSMMLGKLDELGSTLSFAPPCAGLTAQFESYCGFMVNSTLTALVFGSDS